MKKNELENTLPKSVLDEIFRIGPNNLIRVFSILKGSDTMYVIHSKNSLRKEIYTIVSFNDKEIEEYLTELKNSKEDIMCNHRKEKFQRLITNLIEDYDLAETNILKIGNKEVNTSSFFNIDAFLSDF